jgi:excisionase family DNA binding protein
MNDQTRPATYVTTPYDPAGYLPVGRDVAAEIMEELRRKREQLTWDGANGLDAMPSTYTISQAAEKTGRPRDQIYRLIQRGKIKARMTPYGVPLWLIPREELQKLILDPPGDSDTSAPAETPSCESNLITNNKI